MKKLLTAAALLLVLAGNSNADLEKRVGSVDSDRLIELVGKPSEGNVLEKVNGLFFRNHEPVSIRIDRETLEEYFSHTDNENALRTASQILKNFEYIEVDSSVGGGISIGMGGTLEAVVNHDGKDLACEVGSSPEYKSTIISKFIYDFGDSCVTTYAFRIDEGHMKLDILNWGVDFLAFLGIDRAKVPEIEKADYAISLNGEYYALFDEKGERLGRLFDNENNKYKRDKLDKIYQSVYDLGVENVRGNIVNLK